MAPRLLLGDSTLRAPPPVVTPASRGGAVKRGTAGGGPGVPARGAPRGAAARRGVGLPGEGVWYDAVGAGNFLDVGAKALGVNVAKSWGGGVLSRVAGGDFPARVAVGGKLASLDLKGAHVNPVGKAAISVRLLDLSGPAYEPRNAGSLKFKAATRTNGKSDHGFVLDRTVAVGGGHLSATAVFGRVKYGSTDGTRGGWRTDASVGVEQRLTTGGFKWALRGGVTATGELVYDLML
ncbi:hypothetical protein BU14_0177s0007 [Porphyra umbilicalis]|uniref:Uncharacterized protein n=1 Tax=Porphyra umbilicalis TaxID=2786 RepID=A0A1X6P7I0_PORUM|nr:hypothetical protein BU14_0177s0007 [Porphyra umbilicalis]|eukprot:OSX76726.1 hypothetical protein BU14_0177s0007 [Porphyra umbilicalis]